MKIETMLLCDSVQVANGKLFILGGGWNMYRSPNFPAVIPIGIALDFSLTRTEIGSKFPLTINIVDEVGVSIIPPMNGQIEAGQAIQEIPKGALLKLPMAMNTILNLPRAGRYTVAVSAGSSKVQIAFDAIFAGTKVELVTPPEEERGQ
jgi:hypothetical protein